MSEEFGLLSLSNSFAIFIRGAGATLDRMLEAHSGI